MINRLHLIGNLIILQRNKSERNGKWSQLTVENKVFRS